jgi:hypothetical protein
LSSTTFGSLWSSCIIQLVRASGWMSF